MLGKLVSMLIDLRITCMNFGLISIDENAHTTGGHSPSEFCFYIQLTIYKRFLSKNLPKIAAVA